MVERLQWPTQLIRFVYLSLVLTLRVQRNRVGCFRAKRRLHLWTLLPKGRDRSHRTPRGSWHPVGNPVSLPSSIYVVVAASKDTKRSLQKNMIVLQLL